MKQTYLEHRYEELKAMKQYYILVAGMIPMVLFVGIRWALFWFIIANVIVWEIKEYREWRGSKE